MFVVKSVSMCYHVGKTLSYNQLKKAVKQKLKWRKEKANDWMWQSHRETQLMIVKKAPN